MSLITLPDPVSPINGDFVNRALAPGYRIPIKFETVDNLSVENDTLRRDSCLSLPSLAPLCPKNDSTETEIGLSTLILENNGLIHGLELPRVPTSIPKTVTDTENIQRTTASNKTSLGWTSTWLQQVNEQSSNVSSQAESAISKLYESTASIPTNFRLNLNFSKLTKDFKGKGRQVPGTSYAFRSSISLKRRELEQTKHINTSSLKSGSSGGGESSCIKQATPLKMSSVVPDFSLQRFNGILPLNTRDLLHNDPRLCVANAPSKGHTPCRRRLRKDHPSDFLNDVANIEMQIGDHFSVEFVHKLMSYALCGNTHRRACEAEFKRILETQDKMTKANEDDFRRWMEALVSSPLRNGEDHSQRQQADTIQDSISTTTSSTNRRVTRSMTRSKKAATTVVTTTTNTWNPGRPYIQNFELYDPNATSKTSVGDEIRTIIHQNLTPEERKPGSIYMYWFPGNFGYVKIGKTEKDPAERMAEWQSQCKHDVESTSEEAIPVEHVLLVEKLVHTELRARRYREKGCRGCGGNHIEWFEVSSEHANKVLQKYARFVNAKPYECVTGTSGPEWQLRADLAQETIDAACQVVEIDVPASRPQQLRKKGRRSTNGRFSTNGR